MTTYKSVLTYFMKQFSRNPRVIFLGQQVADQDFYGTLKDVPLEQRLEMPVAEEMQLGMSIGLAMTGRIPISIYQRIDFLPRAMDQLVNHLNLSQQHVIIRTTIGSKVPLDTGPQHSKDLVDMFKVSCKFPVFDLLSIADIYDAYAHANISRRPVLIIERQDKYDSTR